MRCTKDLSRFASVFDNPLRTRPRVVFAGFQSSDLSRQRATGSRVLDQLRLCRFGAGLLLGLPPGRLLGGGLGPGFGFGLGLGFCLETGAFFGVAPGTGPATNRNAIETMTANAIFTNTALTSDGDVWWEGLSKIPPAGLIDWQGQPYDPASGKPAAHPNARFTVPAEQCPSIASEWQDPAGVPISAFLFGGRRSTAVPLVTEAFDWSHGVYLAANLASEGTAAAENKVGALRRDPFAMLPFCGYAIGDYFAHWIELAKKLPEGGAHLPRIYLVNWFRKGADGKFLWPGFGDNIRVLKWVVERAQGRAGAQDSAIGLHPLDGELDLAGLDIDEAQLAALVAVDPAEWREEASGNARDLAALGILPTAITEQQAALEARLG